MAPTDRRLGGPLPHQLPNQPPTYPYRLKLCIIAQFQMLLFIQYYAQFLEIILAVRANYRRVTERFAMELNPIHSHGLVESY